MSYSAVLARIKSRVVRRRNSARDLRSVRQIGFPYLMLLLARQRSTLIWTLGFSLIHLAELLALAWCHYIFFPPISLAILRMLSAFAFVAPAASLTARALDSDAGLKDADVPPRRERMLRIAVSLVGFSSVASISILGWITFATNLHLVTPPIFRALIVSSIVALPAEALIGFLISNRRLFLAPTLRRSSRWFALWCYLAGIGCIVLDLPGVYLVATLVPRLLFARYLWNQAAAAAQSRFLALVPLRSKDAREYFVRFFRRFGMTSLLIGAYEYSFYHSLAWFTATDTNRALLIFLVHKFLHIAALIAARGALNSATQHAAAIRLGHGQQLRAFRARNAAAWAVGLLTALLVLPLIFTQKEAIFWIAPTGDSFHLSLIASLVWCAVAGFRSFAILRLLTLSLARYKKLEIIFLGLTILLPCIALAHCARPLSYLFDIESVFVIYGIFDCAVALSVSLLCGRILRASCSQSKRESVVRPRRAKASVDGSCAISKVEGAVPLRTLLTADGGSAGADSILYLETSREAARSFVRGAESRMLREISGVGCRFSTWGRSGVFLRIPVSDREAIRSLLVSKFAAILNSVDSVQCSTDAAVDEIITGLFGANHPASSLLYDRSIGALRPASEPPKSYDLASSLAALPKFIRVDAASNWTVPKSATYEEERAIFEYLNSLSGGSDPLDPAANWLVRSGAGLTHLNSNGAPSSIIFLRPADRGSLDELRRAAFALNFRDAFCKNGGTSK